MIHLEAPVREWHCPNCNARDTTREHQPHTRFHTCPGVGGLTAPMLEAGTDARVVARERDDYISGEDVRLNADGRPIASISTEYADGRNDLVVFAPTATNSARS